MMKQFWTLNDRVRFWLYDLTEAAKLWSDIEGLVPPSEKERAEAMGSKSRAQTFLVSRALLRKHLGEILDFPPPAIEIVSDSLGKPSLRFPRANISFSISHSGERLLIAIDPEGGALGVDLERRDEKHDLELISRHLFTPVEQNELAPLSGRERQSQALRFWCLKEASYKMGQPSEMFYQFADEIEEDYVYAACFGHNVAELWAHRPEL